MFLYSITLFWSPVFVSRLHFFAYFLVLPLFLRTSLFSPLLLLHLYFTKFLFFFYLLVFFQPILQWSLHNTFIFPLLVFCSSILLISFLCFVASTPSVSFGFSLAGIFLFSYIRHRCSALHVYPPYLSTSFVISHYLYISNSLKSEYFLILIFQTYSFFSLIETWFALLSLDGTILFCPVIVFIPSVSSPICCLSLYCSVSIIVEVTTKPVFHFFLDGDLFSWRRLSHS